MRKILALILTIYFFQSLIAQDYYANIIVKDALNNAKKSNLDNFKIKEIQKIKQKLELGSTSKPYTNNDFRKELTNIISIEEFSHIFESLIDEYSLKYLAERRIKFLSTQYSLSKLQKEAIKAKVVTEHIQESVLSLYYGFDYELSQEKTFTVKTKHVNAIYNYLNNYSPNKNEGADKLTSLKVKALKIGISKIKIDSIETLYKYYNKKTQEVSQSLTQQRDNELIAFNQIGTSNTVFDQSLKSEIKSLLTFKEFKDLFYNQFEFKIKQEQDLQFKFRTKDYTLDAMQKERLREITDFHSEKLVIAKEYYNELDSRWQAIEDIKNEANTHFENALIGLQIAKKTLKPDRKTENFITRANKAGVSKDNIAKIIKAYEIRENDLSQLLKDQKDQKEKYIVVFQNQYLAATKINNTFKKELNTLLTLDQFSIIFKDQFTPRINELTRLKYLKVIALYKLDDNGKQAVKKMIFDQTFKEVVIQEYYGFDPMISRQKLKVLKFKFERVYRDQIKSLTQK